MITVENPNAKERITRNISFIKPFKPGATIDNHQNFTKDHQTLKVPDIHGNITSTAKEARKTYPLRSTRCKQ